MHRLTTGLLLALALLAGSWFLLTASGLTVTSPLSAASDDPLSDRSFTTRQQAGCEQQCATLWLPLLLENVMDHEIAPPGATAVPEEDPTATPSATATAQPEATPLPTTTPLPVEWDSRFDGLNVSLIPAADCSDGCWRLISALFEDVDTSGGNHNVYGRMQDEGGTELTNAAWHVAWSDGSVRALTKPFPEWADVPIWACYNWPHEPGGYRAFAGDTEWKSDVISGMGLPQCSHVNFRLIWRWVPAGAPPPSTPVPTVMPSSTPVTTPVSTPVATPITTPSPTATPGPGAGGFSGQVVQTFANCGLTQLFGVVHDSAGNPLPGTRLRVTWDGAGDQTIYATAGSYIRPETDASGWDVVLAGYALANSWRVAVVDDAGTVLGQELSVWTDSHCDPATGVNVAKIRFAQAP